MSSPLPSNVFVIWQVVQRYRLRFSKSWFWFRFFAAAPAALLPHSLNAQPVSLLAGYLRTGMRKSFYLSEKRRLLEAYDKMPKTSQQDAAAKQQRLNSCSVF